MNKLLSYEKLWMLSSLIVISAYATLATMGNLDLRDGRFALFMDERITFDGVYKILHPIDFIDFILNIADGGDHRYGRSLWYSLAFFSFIPERLFGESGLIVADRTFQLLIVITAFVLLSVTFLKHWFCRLLLLASMLAMPYTAYYTSMPKPEPLQLLFIGFFLFFYKKYQMSLQGWYWIFLGLAFGTKISTLPVVLVILAASIFQVRSENYKSILSNLTGAFGYFLVGLMIAVPILIPHLLIGFIAFKLIYIIIYKKIQIQNLSIASFSIAALLFFCNFLFSGFLAYKFKLKIPFAVWFNSTFLNTSHGSDSNSINFFSWVNFTLDQWLIAPLPFSMVLAILGLCLVVNSVRQGLNFGLVIFTAGLMLNISIFSATHRLWGFYLFTGSILMLVGLFSLMESNFDKNKETLNSKAAKLVDAFTVIFISFLMFIVVFWWAPVALKDHIKNSSRTSSDEYNIDLISLNMTVKFLSDFAVFKSEPLNVSYDPAVFLPRSTKDYLITEFWGPFTSWDENFDIIILGTSRSKNNDKSRDSPSYRDFLIESGGYSRYVVDDSLKCKMLPCYIEHQTLPNGVRILVAKHLLAH
jgi:hypothetical protein